MKIKLSLSHTGRHKTPDHTAQFELTGKSWTENTRRLATAGGKPPTDNGKQSITSLIADIDPVLVDDFRKTL
jgi:hypothetical protein